MTSNPFLKKLLNRWSLGFAFGYLTYALAAFLCYQHSPGLRTGLWLITAYKLSFPAYWVVYKILVLVGQPSLGGASSWFLAGTLQWFFLGNSFKEIPGYLSKKLRKPA